MSESTSSRHSGASPKVSVRPVARCRPVARPPGQRCVTRLTNNASQLYRDLRRQHDEDKALKRTSDSRSEKESHNRLPQTAHEPWDDDEHHLIVHRGDVLHRRYQIQSIIGKGSFGIVVGAMDLETKSSVAVKIVKGYMGFTVQAESELEILLTLRAHDPYNIHNIVRLLDFFLYRNHRCLVFEHLDMNLFTKMKRHRFHPMSLNETRCIGLQILQALNFMCRPSIGVIHCDIKPENILLMDAKKTSLKVADFGSSCVEGRQIFTYIQSRFYRSPEIVLNSKYSFPIDIWSLGCLLAELHTGETLFHATSSEDLMYRMVSLLGPPPAEMIRVKSPPIPCETGEGNGKNGSKYFDSVVSSDGTVSYKCKIAAPRDFQAIASLEEFVGSETGGRNGVFKGRSDHSESDYSSFVDLLYQMLRWDPQRRIRPNAALKHPFFSFSPPPPAPLPPPVGPFLPSTSRTSFSRHPDPNSHKTATAISLPNKPKVGRRALKPLVEAEEDSPSGK